MVNAKDDHDLFFLLRSQSHQLVRPVDAAQQTASVSSAEPPAASSAAPTVCAAPTANTTGDIRLDVSYTMAPPYVNQWINFRSVLCDL